VDALTKKIMLQPQNQKKKTFPLKEMAGLAASFSMPGSFGAAKGHVMSNKTVLSGLAVIFIVTFGSMVVSAFCADHIHRSSCGATDEHAKQAYTWSWVSAVMSGLVAFAAVGGLAFVMFYHPKAR
jgi:hypothetical protein